MKNAQKWMTSNDPNYQSKKERKEELKNNRPMKGKVVSFDEKCTVAVKHYGERPYSKEQPKVEAKHVTTCYKNFVFIKERAFLQNL